MSTVSLRPNATRQKQQPPQPDDNTNSNGKYNNFVSSFTETYHKELSLINSLDIMSLPESPMSNISPSSPISSYNPLSPNTSPYSQSNTSKSGI
eukprot:541258_1